jgi:hypothetical protein
VSVLLEAVAEARELRQQAEREFRRALVRAAEAHSLREIARVAGITFSGVAYLLRRERGEKR